MPNKLAPFRGQMLKQIRSSHHLLHEVGRTAQMGDVSKYRGPLRPYVMYVLYIYIYIYTHGFPFDFPVNGYPQKDTAPDRHVSPCLAENSGSRFCVAPRVSSLRLYPVWLGIKGTPYESFLGVPTPMCFISSNFERANGFGCNSYLRQSDNWVLDRWALYHTKKQWQQMCPK